MAEMKRIDYEEKAKGEKAKAALNEAKLKQVNQDYADGGVVLMSEKEKIESENKKNEEWTLSEDIVENSNSLTEIIISKHRNGETGIINLNFNKNKMLFENIDNPDNLNI